MIRRAAREVPGSGEALRDPDFQMSQPRHCGRFHSGLKGFCSTRRITTRPDDESGATGTA